MREMVCEGSCSGPAFVRYQYALQNYKSDKPDPAVVATIAAEIRQCQHTPHAVQGERFRCMVCGTERK